MITESSPPNPAYRLEKWISLLLRWGVYLCATILAVGWVLGDSHLMNIGVIVLMSLPILRVILSLFLFWSLKDYAYVFLSGAVLGILASGFILGKAL